MAELSVLNQVGVRSFFFFVEIQIFEWHNLHNGSGADASRDGGHDIT